MEFIMASNKSLQGKGRLEVITGSMFSGKTEELMRRLKRAEFARQNVLTIKHQIDNRKSGTSIYSHDGRERKAFAINEGTVNVEKILDLANNNIYVVGIDEIQFFPNRIVEIILHLVRCNKRVIVVGLDLDFRGEPFGVMPTLLAFADEVVKLKAICVICYREAQHTQRLINGGPANYDDPLIVVGASEMYEPRCRDCFQIDKAPSFAGAVKTEQLP